MAIRWILVLLFATPVIAGCDARSVNGQRAPARTDDGGASDGGHILDGSGMSDGGRIPDGSPPDGGGGSTCPGADRTCPPERPYAGGACEGELACDYPEAGGAIRWRATCASGTWRITCEGDLPGGCGAPLSEYCNPPFEGSVAGATVDFGPASATEPFRPFQSGEQVAIEWGPQGLPMVTFRLRLTGAELVGCAEIETRMTLGGVTNDSSTARAQLHCGLSLMIYAIIPFDVAEPRDYEMDIAATVHGIGTASATVRFLGGR